MAAGPAPVARKEGTALGPDAGQRAAEPGAAASCAGHKRHRIRRIGPDRPSRVPLRASSCTGDAFAPLPPSHGEDGPALRVDTEHRAAEHCRPARAKTEPGVAAGASQPPPLRPTGTEPAGSATTRFRRAAAGGPAAGEPVAGARTILPGIDAIIGWHEGRYGRRADVAPRAPRLNPWPRRPTFRPRSRTMAAHNGVEHAPATRGMGEETRLREHDGPAEDAAGVSALPRMRAKSPRAPSAPRDCRLTRWPGRSRAVYRRNALARWPRRAPTGGQVHRSRPSRRSPAPKPLRDPRRPSAGRAGSPGCRIEAVRRPAGRADGPCAASTGARRRSPRRPSALLAGIAGTARYRRVADRQDRGHGKRPDRAAAPARPRPPSSPARPGSRAPVVQPPRPSSQSIKASKLR